MPLNIVFYSFFLKEKGKPLTYSYTSGQTSRIFARMDRRSAKVSGFFVGSRRSAAGW